MTRAGTNFLVDLFLASLLFTYLWTSFIVKFIFPPGTRAAGWTLWGLGYDAWCNVQFGFLVAMTLTVLVHLMLHWKWVCGFVATRVGRWSGRRIPTNNSSNTLYGVSTLITIFLVLGTLLTVAELMVQPATR